jgi:hypothetical protein
MEEMANDQSLFTRKRAFHRRFRGPGRAWVHTGYSESEPRPHSLARTRRRMHVLLRVSGGCGLVANVSGENASSRARDARWGRPRPASPSSPPWASGRALATSWGVSRQGTILVANRADFWLRKWGRASPSLPHCKFMPRGGAIILVSWATARCDPHQPHCSREPPHAACCQRSNRRGPERRRVAS